MEYCMNCGAEAPEGTDFCPKCGLKITTGQTRVIGGKKYQSPEHKFLGTLSIGLSVILLGALLSAAVFNVTPLVTLSNFLAWFLVGHGAILVMKFFAHRLLPNPGAAHYGNLVGGAIVAAFGVLFLVGLGEYFWPVAITSVGVYVISMGVLKYYTGNGHSA